MGLGIFEVYVENGLIRLEDHSRVHLEILIKIEPSAIRAWFSIAAVTEHPRATIFEAVRDEGLVFAQQLIIDADVAVGCATDHDVLADLWFEEVDLTG